jgi:two-component system, LuxR family, sensor kinase FixL
MWSSYTKRRAPWLIVTAAVLCVAVIAVIDRQVHAQVPLALLYILPAAFAGAGLTRWQVPIFGAFCAVVAELADAFPWNVTQGIPRDALYFSAYTVAGLYVSEMIAKRRLERDHVRAVEIESEARLQAEEQLRLLIGTSSIAIMTSDDKGTIIHANEAAERLFASNEHRAKIEGQAIANLVPALARAPMLGRGQRQLKTMMQCQGVRIDHEPFFADVWFSTYRTTEGSRLTAMVVDSSREVRDREEASLQQVLTNSRLLIGAVSHEIRNICAAIGFVQDSLSSDRPDLASSSDFQALRKLTSALERIASVELSQVKHQAGTVHLDSFLRELRIIVAPSLRESGIDIHWEQGDHLPAVWADQQGLLQVFLNLIRNSEAALEDRSDPTLSLSVVQSNVSVQIRIADNGPGVREPENLFHPFRKYGHPNGHVGLGLYLSRALISGFRGDLRYAGDSSGAVFIVELLPAEVPNLTEISSVVKQNGRP